MKEPKVAKYSYKDIKLYIEGVNGNGCFLITNEIDFKKLCKTSTPSVTKIYIKCKCGNIFKTDFHTFKNKNKKQCNLCSTMNTSAKIKNNYEDICESIKKYGYILLDDNYLNNKQKLTVSDQNGYLYYTCYNYISSGKKLRKFHVSNPYTIQNIKLWCKLNNKPYIIVSEEYKGNHKYLLWKCIKEECGEIFSSTLNNIESGFGCPYCAGVKVGLSNCLATKNPELAKEWHSTLNGDLTPSDVTCGSNKKVWWKCNKCGYEWCTCIINRAMGIKTNCPKCNLSKGEQKISEYLKMNDIVFEVQKSYINLLGLGNKNLSYDFYLPRYNMLIEYQGEQHERYIEGLHKSKKDFEKQKEHDRRKREYAFKNNINLLEIWYWDFNRVEEILMKNLSL